MSEDVAKAIAVSSRALRREIEELRIVIDTMASDLVLTLEEIRDAIRGYDDEGPAG